ncbi:probable receptor-like protein kinase At1g49730 [Amaranthus tricolor]|uniref:probable receptor-like protein kinase At1g49730 n=1 Tax=Amaranthus tricolor TaxID=29722 RepID=UPI0025909FAE|nr:probable receptor-like protein kinase At1g49730 [Amaranthus tricolor]
MSKTQVSSSSSNTRNSHFCKFFRLFLNSDHSRQVSYLKRVSLKELNRATDGFGRIITCDSQTITYQARFQDGSVSVVKEVRSFDEGNECFNKELQLLGRLHHRHVVALRGYFVGRRSFLIFENTAKASLKEHLNDPLKTPLSWKTRVQIAIGVAAALEYLQFFCEPPVDHIDISSSNIILDEKLVPKLSNISCLCTEERANILPQFGALLLELITGQSSAKESANIAKWIHDLRSSLSMHNMIDPELEVSCSSKELRDLLNVARLCIKVENTRAFSISHAFWYLQKRFGVACD